MSNFRFVSHRKEVDEQVDNAIAKMLEEWGMVAQGFATAYAPKDTGRLRSSITYETDPEAIETVIGTNVEYAPYVEFNDKMTHKTGKAHYMRDAIATHVNKYEQIARQELGSLLK